jgi:glutamyl-Q tRNA(Asp) synthetase
MITTTPVLRFAPSPNGRLHLGHAFSALFTASAASALGGAFLLRIEDIDPARSRPEFEAGILEDLTWLGLAWPHPVMRQSTRMAGYLAAAEQLRQRDLLYPCFCSRRQAAAEARGIDPDGVPLYSGICRRLFEAEVASRLAAGERAQWRLKMDRAVAEAGAMTIAEAPARDLDASWSETRDRPADPHSWGDAVLIRKDTPTSYHLSVVVDDAAQGVTHVTRGRDLFAATGLHVLLQHLLGLPAPRYCHHRLLLDRDGQKLAKSIASMNLKSLREQGVTPLDIRRQLGFA